MKTAALLAGLLLPVQLIDPAVEKACPKGVCTVPAERLQMLLDAHNSHIDRIRHLEAELRNADTSCFLKRLNEA